MRRKVFLLGTGRHLPGDPIPVERAQEVLGPLTDAPPRIRRWMEEMGPVMRQLLDIEVVHYALDPRTRQFTEDNVTMAEKAARQALEAAGMTPGDLDLLCYGSAHQDQMPTASVRIQKALGIDSCAEFSIHANCTSAYKAFYLAHHLLADGHYDRALAVSAGISSSELRAEYFNQQKVDKESLFLRWFLSDGAGAAVLGVDPPARGPVIEVECTYVESVGGNRPSLMFNHRPAYWMSPVEEFEAAAHHLRQTFRNELATGVFQEPGGSVFLKGYLRMLARAGIDPLAVDHLQVNLPARHIVESVAAELQGIGFPRERIDQRMARMGYAGPPMTFLAMDAFLRETGLGPGRRLASFVTEVSQFMQAGWVLRRCDGGA